MAGRVIRGATALACWNTLEQQIWDYWGRLAHAGSDRGVIAVTPVFKLDPSHREGEVALGGDFVRKHEPMATSEQVKDLFERSNRQGVLLGKPPSVLALGIQRFAIEEQDGSFLLRTSWYKHCLMVRVLSEPGGEPTWFAMRLESDSHIGQNSWLLNHPIHHVQLGLCDELRIMSTRGRSLLSFVDAALRFFAVEVWSELYPSLYLHLSDSTGRFSAFTQSPEGSAVKLTTPHADAVKSILRQGRADKVDWFLELEQWREDVDDRSECAPELFDVFAGEI